MNIAAPPVDQYGCIRCLTQRNSQTWLLMNQRSKGWQSSAVEYPSLAHLLLCEQLVLVERRFDEYGIYWAVAKTVRPNLIPAVYLGRGASRLWKGNLEPALHSTGTKGTLRLEYSTEHKALEWRFTVLGQPESDFAVITDADQVYLELVPPPE